MTVRRMGHRARVTAVVGAVAATGAVTLMAVVSGTAAAAPATGQAAHCVDNVNVRAEPDPAADIVAVCERGQSVVVGETRDGYVHLLDLEGWSAQQYISVNGRMPARSGTSSSGDTTGRDQGATGTSRDARTTGRSSGTGTGSGTGGTYGADNNAGTGTPNSADGTATTTPTTTATPGDGSDARDTDETGTDGSARPNRGLAGLLGG